VRALVDQSQRPRQYSVPWDGKDDAGQPVGSGVYLYRLVAEDRFQQTHRMLLVR
jgi:hypothetical protein